ncbi:MAG: response regulator transcription factor [Pyrinomonadaceae bacterium]
MNSQILMIDGDERYCGQVRDYLSPFGFEVTAIYNGADGLDTIKLRTFDAVFLDARVPGLDGFSVLRAVRTFSDVPILMLAAGEDEADRIVGLEVGADDYLPKSLSTRELLARLRAVTRRSKPQARSVANSTDSTRSIRIELSSRQVTKDGRALAITSLEFDLLVCLARSAGRVITRDQILDEISGRNYDVFDRSIDVHVCALRKKLGDDPKNPQYIKTVRSVGYILVPNIHLN